jgi:glycosyltransferase involved in cell wall biosynthesis
VKVTVLIPAFNEETNITRTLSGIRAFEKDFCKKHDIQLDVLVIDDCSEDKTAEKSEKTGVKVIKLANNLGKGGAIQEGLKYANGNIIVFLDADLKESSLEVSKLIMPILNNESDVTIAKFKPSGHKGGFGLVKSLAFYGVKFFTGKEITSALSGQRAFKKQVLSQLKVIPSGYGLEVGMLIDILKNGFRVKEVEVDMFHDVTGRDLKGFVHRGKQFIDILKILINKIGERKSSCFKY